MPHVQSYMLFVPDDREKANGFVAEQAKELEIKKQSLVEVVQSLGPYINDDDPTIRSRAVEFLSEVVGHLPPNFLSRQQTEVICQFLCDRIQDGGALMGLSKLSSSSRFNGAMATMTFRAIIENFLDLQIRPQTIRLQVLKLLNDLMSRHRPAIKDLGSESLVGITDLVSGEKDPRNLMIIFSILRVVMIEWHIESHAEILFDSVYCYFPITFRPPPNDPYGITAQDLKDRLRDCIAASQSFAPYAFPQLLDKLDSTSSNVKRDVLQAIASCATSYGLNTMSNYSVTLWDSIKFEVINVQEEDVAQEALRTLESVGRRLAQGSASSDEASHLARYLKPILKECREHLQEPMHKQAKPAADILRTLGSVSSGSLYLIIKDILPFLMTMYDDADSIPQQRSLMEILVMLLDAAISVYGTPSAPPISLNIENPLKPFKDRLFELSSQALMSGAPEEVSFRIVAITLLLRLSALRSYLEDSEIGMFLQYLDEIISGEDPNGRDDFKKEAIQALVEISKIKSNLIMEITVPAFMARLSDLKTPDRKDYMVTLEGLAHLSVEKYVSDTIIRRLLSKLDSTLQTDHASAYGQAIFTTIDYILSQRRFSENDDIDYYYERIVVKFSRRAALASIGHEKITILNEEKTLEILGRLSIKIIHALREHKQKSVSFQTYLLYSDDESFQPVPVAHNVSETQKLSMILSTAFLAGISFKNPPPLPSSMEIDLQSLLEALVNFALQENPGPVQRTVLRQIGLIVNKFQKPEETSKVVDLLVRLHEQLAESGDAIERSIRIIFWLAKGLILRLSHTNQILQKLLELLSNKDCSLLSARGFGLILAPDEILSKENGAAVRLLAKQKVFSICTPTIAQCIRETDSTFKQNYLIALSGILKFVPTEVIMPEINTLLPLLLQSLDLNEADVKGATIENLTVVCQENPTAVEGHVGSLVTRLLKSATNPQTNPPEVRLRALRCLRTFPGRLKDSNLLPFRNSVTRNLLTILDDPKRNVRKAAVECRAAWFAMDEPQSE